MKEVKIETSKLKELVDAARTAGAGADDGFWADVATELDATEDSKKVKVEARLTKPRD